MQAIRATNIADHVMIGPPIRFDEKGQNLGIPSAAVQNRNRTPTVVLPADVATMTPVLPSRPGRGGRDPIATNPSQGVMRRRDASLIVTRSAGWSSQ